MKHIISFLFVVCLLALSFSFSNHSVNAMSYFKEGYAEFVVPSTTDLSFLPKEASFVFNGGDIIVSAPSTLSRYLFDGLKNIKGVVFKFEGSFETLRGNFNLKYFSDNQNGKKHYYAFSNSFDRFVFVNGKKVNMHIVEDQGKLVVGFPIILTSY